MLNLPARIYSQAVWETIRYRTKEYHRGMGSGMMDSTNKPFACSTETALMLRNLCWLFGVKRVIEIGTYVGKSATAMSEGMKGGRIDTCDSETPDELIYKGGTPYGTQVITHRELSTLMLARLQDKADLFFFDGRIMQEDVGHIERLSHDKTVYLFDDAEGIEKGVCNMLLLQHLGIIVYPEEGQTLGMIIRKIGLTRQ